MQLRRTAGEPWEAKLSFWRSLGVRKEAALRQQNMRFPLYFTGVRAVWAKSKSEAKQKKCLKSIVFYRPRCDSVNSTGVTFELANCVYYCILQMQMRCLGIAKTNTKKCDVRFLLRFTILNAIAQNRKQEFRTPNANVSKPSPLRIKMTCRMSKGRNEEAKTAKLVKTFNQN